MHRTDDSGELERRRKRAIVSAFIFFVVGLFLAFLWFELMAALAQQLTSGPPGTQELTEMFLAMAQVIGIVAFAFIATAFALIVYWAHLRGKRRGRKVLIPKAK